jgi:FtsP/CotA-like multicopper oxidase with cupredoxin domain
MLQLVEHKPIGENAMISLSRWQPRCLASIAMLFAVAFTHSQVLVQPAAPTPALAKLLSDSGPCAYKPIDLNNPEVAGKPFQNPPELVLPPGGEKAKLDVVLTDPQKVTIGGCGVKLRSYNGALVGPTIRLKPGDTLNLTLHNGLPKESPEEVQAQFEDENNQAHLVARPHSFNTTNMHYHGLHVSPENNSDNVLLAIAPGEDQDYEVALPKDHPTGTFWYHPHAHGSTSIQVGSGMQGAIIVEDDPKLLPASLAAANKNEKILLFQSILYNRNGEVTDIESFFPSPSIPTEKNCKAAKREGTWECSRRMTTVNGQIVPVITMRPGEVARWRMIDTSFRETIELQLDDHVLHEIALDGIYTGTIDDWDANTLPIDLEPGYRTDVVVQAKPCGPEHGHREELALLARGSAPAPASLTVPGSCTYGLWNRAVSSTQSLRGDQQRDSLLAILEVKGEPVTMTLPTPAEMAALRHASVPLPLEDISPKATGVQEVVYKLGQDTSKKSKNYFQVNYLAYDPANERRLKLNATDQWTVTTVGDPASVPGGIPPLPHVFHIHVNPFQIVRKDPNGKDERVWKDTVLIPAGNGKNSVTFYTTYTDFKGKFVMHCHILDHEDLGMMEVDDVVDDVITNMPVETMGRHMDMH